MPQIRLTKTCEWAGATETATGIAGRTVTVDSSAFPAMGAATRAVAGAWTDENVKATVRKSACKPGSVLDSHSSGMCVAAHLERPTRGPRGPRVNAPLFGLAPGGVCRAVDVAAAAVRSYRTFSPLPPAPDRCRDGGLLSVALSVGSRRPGVTWHPARWSPDFPPRRNCGGATVRPTPADGVWGHNRIETRCRLEAEMRRFKARIAGQIAGNSCSIAKICNDEAVHFSPKMHAHE